MLWGTLRCRNPDFLIRQLVQKPRPDRMWGSKTLHLFKLFLTFCRVAVRAVTVLMLNCWCRLPSRDILMFTALGEDWTLALLSKGGCPFLFRLSEVGSL